jgi:hypothetical protein
LGVRRWEMGDGRWEMGDGRWEMGDGRWEMGDGRWEMGRINPTRAVSVLFDALKMEGLKG